MVITVPNENGDGTLWKRLKNKLIRKNFVPLENFSLEEISRHGDAHLRKFCRQSVTELLCKIFREHSPKIEIRCCQLIDFPYYDKWINHIGRIPIVRNLLSVLIKLEIRLSKAEILSNFSWDLIMTIQFQR